MSAVDAAIIRLLLHMQHVANGTGAFERLGALKNSTA
jgi:hypothetical protein